MGTSKLTIPRSLLFYEDDIADRAASIIFDEFKKVLRDYQELKGRIKSLEEARNNVEKRVKEIEVLINSQLQELAKAKALRIFSALVLVLILILALVGRNFVIMLLSVIILAYALSQHDKVVKTDNVLRKLEVEKQSLTNNVQVIQRELGDLREKLRSFKVPTVTVEAFKVYVPVGIYRLDEGERHLLLTPWSKGEEFRLSYVVDRSALNEGIRRFEAGEEIYLESILREKDAGYKIYKALVEMKLWELVLSSRSPEELLREAVEEAISRIISSIEEETVSLKLERVGNDFAKLVNATLQGRFELVPDAPQERYMERDLESITRSLEVMSSIEKAAKELRDISSFVREAVLLEKGSDVYSKLVEEAIKRLIEVTIPLNPIVLRLRHNTLFCPRCSELSIERYVAELDLRRWVFDRVLGGVHEDPDIVTPHPIVEEVVRDRWDRIVERSYKLLPLPGVDRNADLKSMEDGYRQGLRTFSLVATGADEMIELRMDSPFDEPVIRCGRCSSVIRSGDGFYMEKLCLPLVKGYMGLLYESADKLGEEALRLGAKVVDSKRTKDERKTTVGIYQQIVQMYIQKKMDAETEVKRLEKYIESLRSSLTPMLAAEAITGLTGLDSSLFPKILENRIEEVSE